MFISPLILDTVQDGSTVWNYSPTFNTDLLITLHILFSVSAEQSVTISGFISNFISSPDTLGIVSFSQMDFLLNDALHFFVLSSLRGFAYTNFTNLFRSMKDVSESSNQR